MNFDDDATKPTASGWGTLKKFHSKLWGTRTAASIASVKRRCKRF